MESDAASRGRCGLGRSCLQTRAPRRHTACAVPKSPVPFPAGRPHTFAWACVRATTALESCLNPRPAHTTAPSPSGRRSNETRQPRMGWNGRVPPMVACRPLSSLEPMETADLANGLFGRRLQHGAGFWAAIPLPEYPSPGSESVVPMACSLSSSPTTKATEVCCWSGAAGTALSLVCPRAGNRLDSLVGSATKLAQHRTTWSRPLKTCAGSHENFFLSFITNVPGTYSLSCAGRDGSKLFPADLMP